MPTPRSDGSLATRDPIDVGANLADRYANPALPHPIARRGGVRTDEVHVTSAPRPAIVSYHQIDTGDLSDHQAITAELDLTHIDTGALRPYQ